MHTHIDESTRRELKALQLLNEMFGTTTQPRRHRVWTDQQTPFRTLDDLYDVAGRIPSTERTSGGRAVWRLTRPDVGQLPDMANNAPYWCRSMGRGDL